ncbi:uncharacterized protein LOC108197541 isoform X3 [Daucus carota subsp. sativus]|uniref:uncharacterized protein LOC108197541 isoform X3 n=2 Tax=Daucus carota subsp. sativus TaxID=79200 RepID=UPI003082E8C1
MCFVIRNISAILKDYVVTFHLEMDRVKDQQQRQLFKQSTWPEFEGYFILFPHQLSSEAGELPGELSSILHVIGQIFPSHQKVWVRSKSLLDSGRGSFTLSSRISGGRRSRKNGSESSGTLGGQHWKKRHHKVTSQRQFNLKTEIMGELAVYVLL